MAPVCRPGLVIVMVAAIGVAPNMAVAQAPVGAASCTGCHTAKAQIDTAIPPIAGRGASEIAQELKAYKAGSRESTVMGRIAKGFSDQELEALAAWFAEQK